MTPVSDANTVRVEVVYAGERRQHSVEMTLPRGAVVGEAIERSGLLETFPELDLSRAEVGIFGEKVALARRLEDDDRVEIYRPLVVSPAAARRLRAADRRRRREAGAKA